MLKAPTTICPFIQAHPYKTITTNQFHQMNNNSHNSSFHSAKHCNISNRSNQYNNIDHQPSFNPVYSKNQGNQSVHQNSYYQNNFNDSRWNNWNADNYNEDHYWNGNQSFGLANQMPRQKVKNNWLNKQGNHNQTVSYSQGGWAQSQFFENSSQQSSKKKKNTNQSFTSISSSHPSQGPKVKLPTVKEDSSNQCYFVVATQTAKHVVCPFNNQHIMEPDRLLTHIGKCKLKSQNSRFYSVCPYDPCHYVYTSELQTHKLVCDKKFLFVVVSNWQQAGQGFRQQESESAFTRTNDSNNLNNTVLQQDQGNSKGYPVSILPQKQQYQDFLLQP